MTILHYVPHSVLYTALPIGNLHSCFVCRRTPGPDLPFGIEMIVRCHIRHFPSSRVQKSFSAQIISFLLYHRVVVKDKTFNYR